MTGQHQQPIPGVSGISSPLPLGRCIYCGNGPNAGLSDEHVVPLALNGNLLLKQASCEACRVITSRFEAKLLRGGFRSAREAFAYNTRSKDRPTHLPIFNVHGEENSRKDIPIGEYPVTLLMPLVAGAYIDTFPNAVTGEQRTWSFRNHDYDKLSGEADIFQFTSNILDVRSLYRLLAKIAHGTAVAYHGLDGFVPFLKPVILDEEYSGYTRFIGTMWPPPPPLDQNGFETELGLESLNDRTYISARIRFFPELGTPFYRVIVGTFATCQSAIDKWELALKTPPPDPHEAGAIRMDIKATRNA
ncbi:MAG: hypothetical protein JO335_01230 [Sphingomonas sp.]|nr:hypothetical protein [Sphingomonas sp.]